jgi:hypothetical protein
LEDISRFCDLQKTAQSINHPEPLRYNGASLIMMFTTGNYGNAGGTTNNGEKP